RPGGSRSCSRSATRSSRRSPSSASWRARRLLCPTPTTRRSGVPSTRPPGRGACPAPARRHAPHLGRPVRPGSEGRVRARRVAGRPLHRLLLVRARGHGPRPPRRGAAALESAVPSSALPEAPCAVVQEGERFLAFTAPLASLEARDPGSVLSMLREADAALADGRFVAGFVAYEAAAAFGLATLPADPDGPPLVWLGVFDAPSEAP